MWPNRKLFSSIHELIDSYKITHWKQLPPDLVDAFSYYEARLKAYDEMVFYGLQYYLEYLEGKVITKAGNKRMRDFTCDHLGDPKLFNKELFDYIVKEHKGRLPLRISAVPEGTVLPTQNILFSVECTDPKLNPMTASLVNYWEPLKSMVWYPTTVATKDRENKKIILKWLIKNGDPNLIYYKLHDFGLRGSTSPESAALGASAHLINFRGTDTIPGIRLADVIYGEKMAGFSIPAAEHFTISAWKKEYELMGYEYILKEFPNGYLAIVGDTTNIYRTCRMHFGTTLKEKILNRDGVLVVRPDSGNPVKVILRILNILGEKFEYYINSKGYKILNDKVRIIQGDGIDSIMIDKILEAMDKAGWSADNITFGSGGGMLQKNIHRDVFKFAYKCSAARREGGEWYDVYKSPITDKGKVSKKGRLKLVHDGMAFRTVRVEEELHLPNLLIPVFENGFITKRHLFSEIRERAELDYFKKAQ